MVRRTMDAYGRVDVLINNAGIGSYPVLSGNLCQTMGLGNGHRPAGAFHLLQGSGAYYGGSSAEAASSTCLSHAAANIFTSTLSAGPGRWGHFNGPGIWGG